jgi:manganese efflux pump family protein
MSPLTVIGLAFGLAMDAFAVAITTAMVLRKINKRHVFRLSFHFGLFQFIMPILGWETGSFVVRWIGRWDHWFAFILLSAIGGRMIFEAYFKKEDHLAIRDPTRGVSLVLLSIATSIDALAVGVSLAMLRVKILFPCLIIGVVAGLMTWIGMIFGRQFGIAFGKRMGIVGGVVLILIGAKIVYSHLTAI